MPVKSIAAQRSFKLALIASIVVAAASAPSFAANVATATVSADVVTPISITNATNLSFGKFYAGAGGSLTVNTSGVATPTGGVTSAGGTASAASFTITGTPSATYAIDTTATTSTLTSGGNSMPFALITAFATGASTGIQSTGALDTSGNQTLYVGGTLTVGSNQPSGAYAGTVSVALSYN